MEAKEFDEKLNELTQRMAAEFARAFNETEKMQELGHEEEGGTMSRSVINDDYIAITTNFTGGKADLFARTFDTALRKIAGVADSQRIPVLSQQTGEYTDRKITYSIPTMETREFLEKLERAAAWADKKKDD